MTRHQRNSTAGSVYTYHERKKDAKQSGYGSDNIRFGKDSMKEFDCCCLTLQPCRNPVITPEGFLFDKEALIEYILQQKKDIARKLKEYEKQKKKEQSDEKELFAKERQSKVEKFVEKESSIISRPHDAFKSKDTAGEGTSKQTAAAASVSNMVNGKDKALPSFWIPTLTPQSKPTLVQKPDEKVRCPMSGKVLKMKDLTPIEFTLAKDGDKRSLITKDLRYVCPVTNDALGNSVPCAALKTSGKVVTMECVEKLIKKDMLDPFNSKKMTDKDIIPLQRGATGFAGSGLKLEAKKDRPTLQA
ncbi:nitric oxide synthase-interacting protein-like [Tubulanus polymorphus]|uniref:nitric oxide synthase-interacting protein-like n=1 Tax=Tubulanus polymorphus TaxID=672921 RepID=UPI003DA42763